MVQRGVKNVLWNMTVWLLAPLLTAELIYKALLVLRTFIYLYMTP
jgi:hypothetical protein